MGSSPSLPGGAHRQPKAAIDEVKKAILANLAELEELSTDELVRQRRVKFRKMGAMEGRFPTVETSEALS